jgi:hypothetical protein
MQSGAGVKVLKTLERLEGVAPLYSAWVHLVVSVPLRSMVTIDMSKK